MTLRSAALLVAVSIAPASGCSWHKAPGYASSDTMSEADFGPSRG